MSRYHATALFLSGFLALGIDCAFAAEAASKSRKKAEPAVDVQALDKKVTDSRHVFVGEGVRIYFVDRRYRETPYIRAAGDGAIKNAMVVVKVVKPLHPGAADIPTHVLVPIETSRDVYREGRSRYDQEVDRLVGKRGIWFGEIVVRKDVGDDQDPVTLLQVSTDGKRAAPAPLPMRYLKEVNESIARLKGGGRAAAALKAD